MSMGAISCPRCGVPLKLGSVPMCCGHVIFVWLESGGGT